MFLIILILYSLTIQLPSLPYHSIKLAGNFTLGYYYLTIYAGTPYLPQTLIPDTGSHITALPCSKCRSCGHNHINKFLNANSSSIQVMTCKNGCQCGHRFVNNTCQFSIGYAQGSSYAGFYFRDKVILGDLAYEKLQGNQQDIQKAQGQAVKASLGCVMNQQANGILGLDRKMDTDLLLQTYKKHTKYTRQQLTFGICYGYDGGMMTIGGVNFSHTSQQKIQLALLNNKMYASKLNKIIIGNDSKKYNQVALFDSGTTYSFFTNNIYKYIMNKIDKYCQNQQNCSLISIHGDKCYKFNQLKQQQLFNKSKQFPQIQMQFGQNIFKWNPIDYLIPMDKNILCAGIQSYGKILLGTTFLRHKNFYFNNENEPKLQIYQANCSQKLQEAFYNQLIKPKNVTIDKDITDRKKTKENLSIEVQEGILFFIVCVIIIIFIILIVIIIITAIKKYKKNKNYKPPQQLINNPKNSVIQTL